MQLINQLINAITRGFDKLIYSLDTSTSLSFFFLRGQRPFRMAPSSQSLADQYNLDKHVLFRNL